MFKWLRNVVNILKKEYLCSMMQSTNRTFGSGVAWSAIERFSIQGSQFLVSLVVARMLLPEDYGVIAMLSIFIALSTSLIDSGMAQALIQREGRTERDLTTALIFNVVISLAIYAIIYMCAPLIARFYGVELIGSVCRIYSLVLIVNSFSVVQQALIAIDLDFRRQAAASLTGVVIGGATSIWMAWRGYGVWALVAQQIVQSIVTGLLLWAMSPWRPRGRFSIESLRELSRFGSPIMLSGLLHLLYTNLYTVVIGRCFMPAAVGLYNRATTISALPSSNISTIIDRALYPILCRRQGDAEAAAESLLRYLRMVCFVVFPMMVGVSIMASPLVELLLGERWLAVVPLLQAVAVANMWDPVMKFMGSMIRSQGRSGDFLRAETLKKVCGVAILAGTLPFGVVAMCWGLVLYALLDITIVVYFSRKISYRLGYRAVVGTLLPTLLLTAAMAATLVLIRGYIAPLSAPLQLTIALCVGVGLYLSLATATRRDEVRIIVENFKNLRG